MQPFPFSINRNPKESSLLQLSLSSTLTLLEVSFCIPHSAVFFFPSLSLTELEILRSTHSLCLFPLWRRVKTLKLAKTRKNPLQKRISDVSTKTNQLHLLINRKKSERRRNLRILSKWKLRMKSTHPAQFRPPYTFTYVKKEYKNILTGFYSHHHSD